MNRRERRIATARAKTAPAAIADLLAQAKLAHQQGRGGEAEALCQDILQREGGHKTALNLLGVIYQDAGRHRLAVRQFAKAIAADELDAACHYNIATSYQILGRRADALAHFKRAIALGLTGQAPERFLLQNPAIATSVERLAERIVPARGREPFEAAEIAAFARDDFLQAALSMRIIRGIPLENFLTQLRRTLLRLAADNIARPQSIADGVADLLCALAQQSFLTDYVFALGDDENRTAGQLRDVLLQRLAAGGAVSPLLLGAVGSYFPLHALAGAQSLLGAAWPQSAADLLRCQLSEPLEEAADQETIPVLTPLDPASSAVMRQYEENPYPRWTTNVFAVRAAEMKAYAEVAGGFGTGQDILIAGCGTGQNGCDIAQYWLDARILAVDLSRTSLAYARRKAREQRLRNIVFAQADILRLAVLDRNFDRIEAMGVLHHLADPLAGWRLLLSLLKPDGVMHVALYSEAARRTIVEARALIAEAGYPATAEGIRAARQAIMRKREVPRWDLMMATVDFHSISGCRDMLFNVIEHRFTIPQIAAFLEQERLSFLGFELPDEIVDSFQRQFPGAAALTDLDNWHTFETANPDTFRRMYVFSVSKKAD